MSDSYITICPVKEVENPKKLASEFIQWLKSKEIIEKELSNCVLSLKGLGYKPGKKHLGVVSYDENILRLQVCGLEIKTEREVFTGMSFTSFTDCVCPKCNKNRFNGISEEDIYSENLTSEQQESFSTLHSALNIWSKNEAENLTCNHCNLDSKIDDYDLGETLALSNLGFTFWNWPEFKDEFIDDVKSILDTEIKVILGHI
ncbi:hypothetical protein [Algibacter sp. 2305UL17-15]|uniref:hypothetical protein n=1 Tax=Algibacter sp. 2305UL17-15 TaxID=3231268 RepID=UPI0034594A94